MSIHLRNLKERRNPLVPAFRLPAEIVTRIFRFLTAGTFFVDTARTCLSFSQVCRFWRKLALGYSALWTSPLFERPQIALEMVRRSKKKPLTVAADFGHVLMHASLQNLLQGSFRIKSLRLLVNPELLETLCDYIHNLKNTLTHVELKRKIVYGEDSDEDEDEVLDEDGAIKAILKYVARRLLSLKLDGFYMPEKLFSFPRLTNLHLRDGNSKMCSCEILEILHLAPLLESINLHYAAGDPEKPALEPSP